MATVRPKMAHDVFICHSSKDKTVADAVCSVLESEGIRCWIAPRDVLAGLSYGEAILEAINGAKVMVVVFSSSANASPQIEREIERAVNRGIRIVQFRIEDVMPRQALEYFLSAPHWLDAFTPPLERHLKVLADQVRALLDRDVAGHAGDPTPATPTVAPAAAAPASSTRRGGLGLVAGAIVLGAVILAAVVWFALPHHTQVATTTQSAITSTPAPAAPASATPPPAAPAAQPVAVATTSPQPAAPAAPPAGSCIVADPTPTPLNVRMAPNGQILGAVANGVPVRVLERQTVNGKAWALIEPLEAGAKSGWVFSSYLNCG
jgi:hypothetical protein